MNYAYDSFETEENGVNSRRQGANGSLRPSAPRGTYERSNGHSNGYLGGPNGHPGHHPGGYGGDTRSLQRPRNAPQSRPDPRGTYSLPRGSTTSSLPSYNTAMQDMTPDFYYLPSQRKYSGEVVRVYVDYNKSK